MRTEERILEWFKTLIFVAILAVFTLPLWGCASSNLRRQSELWWGADKSLAFEITVYEHDGSIQWRKYGSTDE